MASILALISRSVFRTLPVVWLDQVCPLGSYQSRQPAFGKLEPGDAVFVVTVPQHSDALWLVAILEQPVRRGGSIVGRTNTVPITDISAHKAALGITAKPRKLAMSLQTPRVLTADAATLLRTLVPRARAAKALPPVQMKIERKRKHEPAAGPKLEFGKLSARARALVQQVYQDPDDRALRGVLADQLLEDHHVWGELISLQLAAKRDNARIAQIIHKHARDIAGDIVNVVGRSDLVIEAGFPRRCRTGKSKSWTSAAERDLAAKAPQWATVEEVIFTYEVPGTFITTLLHNPATANLRKIGYDKEVLLKRATPGDPWSIAKNLDSLGLVLPSLPAAELARVKAPRAGCAALEAARAKVARPKRR